MRKSMWTGLLALFILIILIFDSRTAIDGARIGLDLCLKSVIPALYPFFIISIYITNSFYGISIPFLQPIGKLFSIPRGAECILIPAFLGGYPVGAQSIAAAYSSGYLGKQQAQRMLAFCSNAGPAFLFGMAGNLFSDVWMAWMLWGIHIITALLVSFTVSPIKDINEKPVNLNQKAANLSYAMRLSVKAMAQICGWIILFRVLMTFLSRWILWILPIWIQTAVTGLLELSNGILELGNIKNTALRFVLCSSMLSCGGVCVMMQTKSVIGRLSLKYYILGKALQTLYSLIFSIVLIYRQYWTIFLVPLIIMPFKMKKQWKSGSN